MGKPRPGAARAPRARFIHSIEALKNPLEIFARNPDAGIGNRDPHVPVFRGSALDAHLAIRAIEFHRIIHEIDQHLLEPETMPHHHAVLASIFN